MINPIAVSPFQRDVMSVMAEHKCPTTCGGSKYNCPINMQNILWKAIHEDKYDRLDLDLVTH